LPNNLKFRALDFVEICICIFATSVFHYFHVFLSIYFLLGVAIAVLWILRLNAYSAILLSCEISTIPLFCKKSLTIGNVCVFNAPVPNLKLSTA
jgi:hypothetical protein